MSRHPVFAVFVAVLAGLLVWATLSYRAREVSLTTNQLCVVIARLVVGANKTLGTPGTPLYRYYRDNPEELRAAHRANQAVLKELPCSIPKETP